MGVRWNNVLETLLLRAANVLIFLLSLSTAKCRRFTCMQLSDVQVSASNSKTPQNAIGAKSCILLSFIHLLL